MSKGKLLTRKQIDDKYKWRLEDIYETDPAWEEEYKAANLDLLEVVKVKGTLKNSATILFEALEKRLSLELKVERLFVYSRMRRDEDNANSTYQALAERAASFAIKCQGELAFFDPEILDIDEKTLDNYFKQDERLSKYKHFIKQITLSREHTLDKDKEQLLAMTGEMAAAPGTIFSMMTDADMVFSTITDPDGNEIEITQGNYTTLMEHPNREFRKEVFEVFYANYKKWENTLAATLAGSVKNDVFYARARKFDSALHASLHKDHVPIEVYSNLISAVHDALPAMHKYMDIKRRKLGVEKLHMYDLYVPMFDEGNIEVNHEEALKMINEAFEPLGEDYNKALQEGLASGTWVDMFENKGKTSGAYSWGVWGTHPYVLLNWNDTINSTFTMAHEFGHAMHTYFSDTTQEYVNAGYPLILAEVASTCNEAIFMNYITKKTTDKKQKLFLANYFLEQFRTTLFRQVMFGEFELIIHTMEENGEPLTSQSLCKVYRKLNELYYGKDVVIDEEIVMEWARIPHFYRSYYVYKYSTGFASAIAISNKILSGSKQDTQNYLEFLKSGGKDFPLDLLKKAGIDLTKPDTVSSALNTFTKLVNEMEKNL